MFLGCLSSINEMKILAAKVAAILTKVNKCSRKYIFLKSDFLLNCVFFLTLIGKLKCGFLFSNKIQRPP